MKTPAAPLAWLGLACALAAPIRVKAGAQQPGAPPPKNPPLSTHRFAGRVDINGQPADEGAVVQLVLFDAARHYTLCGETTVSLHAVEQGANPRRIAGYQAAIFDTPECMSPDNSFQFYVNGVYAASASFASTAMAPLASYLMLNVSPVALRTSPEQGGVRLVWLTGKVQDAYGRPPVVGTSVQARADGVPCQGTGRTENLYWMPKAPNAQAVGIKGFYFIPIEMVPGCVDRTVTFKVTVVGSSAAATIAVTTPEYGRAVEVPGLVLPARPD